MSGQTFSVLRGHMVLRLIVGTWIGLTSSSPAGISPVTASAVHSSGPDETVSRETYTRNSPSEPVLPTTGNADSSTPGFDVTQIDGTLVLSAVDRNTRMLKLTVRVSVRNDTSETVSVERSQFELFARSEPVPASRVESNEGLTVVRLEPEKSARGLLWFAPIPFDGDEMPLELRWTPPYSDQPVTLNLNACLRRLNVTSTEHIGPQAELCVLRVRRGPDILSAWALRDTLTELHRNSTQRVILTPDAGDNLTVTEEFLIWLVSMLEPSAGGHTQAPLISATPVPATTLQFRFIGLAGFSEQLRRSYRIGRYPVRQYRTLEDAVCTALTPIYRFVPMETVIRDLKNSRAGVRRAAMAGGVDRLTAEQAAAILEQARSSSEELQIEVAPVLSLIPGEEAVHALKDLCLNGSAAVTPLAMRSLVSSRDETVGSAMGEIWTAGITAPRIQSDLVRAIVDMGDDRWHSLVSAYVSMYLQQAGQPDTGTVPAESIAGALRYLQRRDQSAILSDVQRQLLHIRHPAVQDMFLQFLLQSNEPGNEAVIRECITRRLAQGTLSSVVASAAAGLRDPSWTEPLLNGARQTSGEERGAPLYFSAALECATQEQLNGFIERKTEFSTAQQTELLHYMAGINHSQWRTMASEMIKSPGDGVNELLLLLAQDASEDSLQILRARLREYVDSLEGTPDASVQGQHFFQTLMAQMSMFVHPECRRLMNQLAIDDNAYVSERAIRMRDEARRRSPAFRMMGEELRLRTLQQDRDADEALEQCLELDPLMPEVYVRRSSIRMHQGRFQESLKDLEAAENLSPDDIEVQSHMALVRVRLNEIDGGLAFAEQIISRAPRNWVGLYNGACAFARATESELPTEAEKSRYADRAIAILMMTASLKFDDVDHLLKDSDLFSLHSHAGWTTVVDAVRANGANRLPDPP